MSNFIKKNISEAKNYIKHGNIQSASEILKNLLLHQPNNKYAKQTLKKIQKTNKNVTQIINNAPQIIINEIVSNY